MKLIVLDLDIGSKLVPGPYSPSRSNNVPIGGFRLGMCQSIEGILGELCLIIYFYALVA